MKRHFLAGGYVWILALVVFVFLLPDDAEAGELMVHMRRLTESEENPRWLPEGNLNNQDRHGNTYRFEVWWTGGPPQPDKRFLFVSVADVTSYPGVCGNKWNTTLPDMRLLQRNNAHWIVTPCGLAARTKEEWPRGKRVRLCVSSFDFGGSAEIECYLEGRKVWTRKRIPIDTDADGLPDVWENEVGLDPHDQNSDAETEEPHVSGVPALLDGFEDEDVAPLVLENAGPPYLLARTALGLKGDGLTAWEEYRGFSVKGKHHRLEPWTKELFIRHILPVSQSRFQHRLPIRHFVVRWNEDPNKKEWKQDGRPAEQPKIVNYNNFSANVSYYGATPQALVDIEVLHSASVEDYDVPPDVLGYTRTTGPWRNRQIITTGWDGICQTAKAAGTDDHQLIPVGKGVPRSIAAIVRNTAGVQVNLQPPDDEYVVFPDGSGIVITGENGILESRITVLVHGAADVLITEVGRGEPFAPCIDPGVNNSLGTFPEAWDTVETWKDLVPLSPNETVLCHVYEDRIKETLRSLPRHLRPPLDRTIGWVVGHEVGHAIDINHYHAYERPPAAYTYMVADLKMMLESQNHNRLPERYDEDEENQIRLHRKH